MVGITTVLKDFAAWKDTSFTFARCRAEIAHASAAGAWREGTPGKETTLGPGAALRAPPAPHRAAGCDPRYHRTPSISSGAAGGESKQPPRWTEPSGSGLRPGPPQPGPKETCPPPHGHSLPRTHGKSLRRDTRTKQDPVPRAVQPPDVMHGLRMLSPLRGGTPSSASSPPTQNQAGYFLRHRKVEN